MRRIEVVIIGGGPAGLAAAVELKNQGVDDILILEREHHLGGILRQCIHDGFGLSMFEESLSGPEYAKRYIDQVEEMGIHYMTDITVIGLTKDKVVTAVSKEGLMEFKAKAVVLAMGCRERTRGAISIPGERPAGIYTAGVAQEYINIRNKMVGKDIIILGSGDIGLIMARRLTLEGANVIGVFEIRATPSGLPRNIEQCLNDYEIPLQLSHTVTDIKGKTRLESVVVSRVDETFEPITGTEKEYACDTLILSAGLIPENELSLMAGVKLDSRTKGAVIDEHYQTSVKGIFAAGNVLQVHDLVDFVSEEAQRLAGSVASYVQEGKLNSGAIEVLASNDFTHVLPQIISGNQDVVLSMRVRQPQEACRIEIKQGGKILANKKMRKALPAEMIQIKIASDKIMEKADVEVAII